MLRSNVAFMGGKGFTGKIGNVLKMWEFFTELLLMIPCFSPRYTKVNRDNDTWTHQLELGWVKMTNLLPNSIYKVDMNCYVCCSWVFQAKLWFVNLTLVLHLNVFTMYMCLVGCTCSPGARQGEWSQTDGSQDHMQWATPR